MSNIVRDYYDRNSKREWERLETPFSRLEFTCGLYLIDKYFPKGGKVCDIGSGSGRYSIELLKRGFEVTLFELSGQLLQLSKVEIERLGFDAEDYVLGDARDLSQLKSNTYNAILMMGPMYHITESDERIRTLHSLTRILKPDGVAVITYLNSWGLIRTGITDFPSWYRDIAILRSMLEPHTFLGQQLSGFTESYWSTPKAALAEVEAAGLYVVSYSAAQGFAGGMKPLIEQLALHDPQAFENVVSVAGEMCELEQFRDSSEHMHIVVRKANVS